MSIGATGVVMYSYDMHKLHNSTSSIQEALRKEEERKGKMALGITVIFFSPIIVFFAALFIL